MHYVVDTDRETYQSKDEIKYIFKYDEKDVSSLGSSKSESIVKHLQELLIRNRKLNEVINVATFNLNMHTSETSSEECKLDTL